MTVSTANCMTCGQPFEAESMFVPYLNRTLSVTVCDECASKERAVKNPPRLTRAERLAASWLAMAGPRYASFERNRLPVSIQPHVAAVLGWELGPKGIGLTGPPRTGKSPLMFWLGHNLHMRGVNVWATSGIEFQRRYLQGMDERQAWQRYIVQCERSEVLLLDDADKLNLSPGVAAEYYGMLEARRNWELPVLCTLNLTGDEITNLGRERSDTATAIVERLRDLCTFIPVS